MYIPKAARRVMTIFSLLKLSFLIEVEIQLNILNITVRLTLRCYSSKVNILFSLSFLLLLKKFNDKLTRNIFFKNSHFNPKSFVCVTFASRTCSNKISISRHKPAIFANCSK